MVKSSVSLCIDLYLQFVGTIRFGSWKLRNYEESLKTQHKQEKSKGKGEKSESIKILGCKGDFELVIKVNE